MAQLGRFQTTVQDTAGNALSGVSVTVYREGATFVSGSGVSPVTLTVRDPGAIVAADTVFIGTDNATTYTVDSQTATTVVLSGFIGTLSPTALDRIVPSNSQPALYSEATAAVSKSNPLTTDSSGEAAAWIEIVPYDVLISGGSATTELKQDILPSGHETITSNAITTGSQVAYIRDTDRALASGDTHTSLRDTTTEIFSVDYQGGFTAAQASTITAGGLTITAGGETITAGDLTVTAGDIILVAAASQIVPGATSLSFRNNADDADNLIITNAGAATIRTDATLRRIFATQGTAQVAGDYALHANWGNTPATVAVTSGSTDTRAQITVSSLGAAQGASPTIILTFKDGTYTNAPFATVQANGGTGTQLVPTWTITATTLTITYPGTPVDTKTYIFDIKVFG